MAAEIGPGAGGTGETMQFLAVDPPHWAARGLAYLLILLFTTAVVAASLVHVPETVSGPFVLVPARGADPVRASRDGIVADVTAAEGQTVAQGAPLFVIESRDVGDRAAELRTLRTELKGYEESLTNIRRRHDSERLTDTEEARRLDGRIQDLTRSIASKRKQLELATELAERYRQSYAEGLMPYVDSKKPQLEADGLAADVEQMQTDLQDARAEREKLRSESAGHSAEWQEQERSPVEGMEKSAIRIRALERELGETHEDRIVARAPCSGLILRLIVRAPGAVVEEGDALSELACSNDRLQAELTLPHSGVGSVKTGHGVKLRYESFPYQRYGVRLGTVRWISPGGGTADNTAGFRALVEIDETAITVDGQPTSLLPGMRGTADVVTGRRALISYAFEPLRQLRENLADAKGKRAEPGNKPE